MHLPLRAELGRWLLVSTDTRTRHRLLGVGIAWVAVIGVLALLAQLWLLAGAMALAVAYGVLRWRG